MNVLFELIETLDGYALGHVQQKLETDNSKAFQLFQLYKSYRNKGNKLNDEAIMKKLYGPSTKEMGALYRLKNRLVNNINQALIELNTAEGKSTFLAEQNLILYRIFKSSDSLKLAEYYLLKAIKYAEANEQYILLDVLYGEMIVFSKDSLTENPATYITKRRDNFKMFNTHRTIDEILSLVTYRLKTTQNLAGQLNVNKEIESALATFSNDAEIFKSVQFKIKFYKAVSQILVQQQKFAELEKFVLKSRSEFISENLFNKQTHDIKIEQLVYLINSLLVQLKYDMVIEYSEILYEALYEFNKQLYDKYIYFYYQAKINSYAVLDLQKAVELQQEVLNKGKIIKDPYFIVFNFANLAHLYFLQANYKQCLKTLQKVYLNDYFPKVEMNLKVELAAMELIARFEADDANNLEYRLGQTKQAFNNEWKDYSGPKRELINLIENISIHPNYQKNPDNLKLAKKFVEAEQKLTSKVFNLTHWVNNHFRL